MRKVLKIIVVLLLLIYYFYIIIFDNSEYTFYYQIALFIILIPYSVYELIQLRKDDKATGSNKFKNRLALSIIGLLVMLLLYFVLK
jgi:hypothetical protein